MKILADNPVSRREFLLGGLSSTAILATGIQSRESAQTILSGRMPSDISGIGVQQGRVRLAFNENPLGASPAAIDAVMQHKNWMNRYDYTNTLQAAIIQHHKLDIPKPSGFDFKAKGERHGLILGVGTTEILQILALYAFMKFGETIEALPSYGQITRVGSELLEAGFNVSANRSPVLADGNHDLQHMSTLINDRTGLVIICNPHNPTGSLLSHNTILKFIDQVPPHVLIAIDEVYIQYVRDKNYLDFIEIAKERNNVIVLRTFSKIYGLGGMRVGYGVAHRNIIDQLSPFSMGLLGRNILSVYAATAALGDHEHVRLSQQTVWKGNDYLTAELKKLGASVGISHANFVWARFGKETKQIVRQLWKRKVMVRAGIDQWDSPNHIRISTGSRSENEAFIWTLERILR